MSGSGGTSGFGGPNVETFIGWESESRDITREDLRSLVRKGLEQTGGNYRVLTELLNMPATDYKRFLNFLRKHHCHVAFQQFRTIQGRPINMTPGDVAARELGDGPRTLDWKKPASA